MQRFVVRGAACASSPRDLHVLIADPYAAYAYGQSSSPRPPDYPDFPGFSSAAEKLIAAVGLKP